MNDYIIINRTYVEITPESAEDGEYSDTGFVEENRQVSFSELVSLMEDHPHPSRSPNKGGTDVWYSSNEYDQDWTNGTTRIESIHYASNNTPNAAKYWKWAAQIAGNIDE